MTARTLSVQLSPLSNSYKLFPFCDRLAMNPSDIDYTNASLAPMSMPNDNASMEASSLSHADSQQQQQLQSNESQSHFSYHPRPRPNLILSLNTPECNPDSQRNPFGFLPITTPGSDFPTPSLQQALPTPTLKQLMAETETHPAHPLAAVVAASSDNQIESIPESVETVSRQYHEMQHQQQQQQQQQQHHHQSMFEQLPMDHYSAFNMDTSLGHPPHSPANSSSHASSPRSYSHDDISNHGDLSASPRSGSVQGSMTSGRSGKNQKLTKKQQLDSLVNKKKEMEIQNQQLRRQAEEYTVACKRLKQKLLILIQGNCNISPMVN